MGLWEREDLKRARALGVTFWPGQRVAVGQLVGVVVAAHVLVRLRVSVRTDGDWHVKERGPDVDYVVQLDAGPRVVVGAEELHALEPPTPPRSFAEFADLVAGPLGADDDGD